MRQPIPKSHLILAAVLASFSLQALAQTSFERINDGIPTGPTEPPRGGQACTLSGGGDGANVVVDPGFEAGTPNPSWTEASTNFGTPLCTVADCGTGGGTGPFAGTWWAWFGGIGAAETASVSQSITIPTGDAELQFQFEVPVCNGGAGDFIEVTLDGDVLMTHTCADGLIDPYELQTIDVSAYADDGTYDLVFNSVSGSSGSADNFFVDDVIVCATGAEPPPPPGPDVVVGFLFEGTVTGISGSAAWASDMRMDLTGPSGSTVGVGGFDDPGPVDWDFDGSGSTDDGTYSSDHSGVFLPDGTQATGQWTIDFRNDWSGGSNTQSWTGTVVTLILGDGTEVPLTLDDADYPPGEGMTFVFDVEGGGGDGEIPESQPVPVNSPWALALLVLLIAGLGLVVVRRMA